MKCALCGCSGDTARVWLVSVAYGRLALKLCRSCYEFFLRAVHPQVYAPAPAVLT